MDGADGSGAATPQAGLGAVATACPYCGVGCGVLATPDGKGGAAIAGDPAHPANKGRLCVKGTMLGETLDLEDRLLQPELDGRPVSWDRAIERVAGAFAQAIREHGPDSVAFYVSGQLLTEDYYVANKLMKGFIGSGNIDTNSRLCMASSVAGHKRAFGADVVPGAYEDFDLADVIVLVGSNLAWCHPVLFQQIVAAKRANPGLKVVNIDPRRTATSQAADIHLDIAPGGDVALFNGLLSWLNAHGARNEGYLNAYTEDAEAAVSAAGRLNLTAIAEATGLSPERLSEFYALWTGAEKVVTVYSQGVNQWSTGTDKVNSIINCHLFTGRIGRPGMGPFSVTGQPNAMGGREVGGLANMLAAHMNIENAQDRERLRRFWRAPRMAQKPGLKAVDLFEALERGRIKALWVMSTNPAVSMPEADRVRAALRETGAFVAVSDILRRTETARLADALLPATGWGEKDGTVTNSERRIYRQRAFLPAPGAARPDWAIVAAMGRALGRALGEDWTAAFSYPSAAAVFREHAALSGFENEDDRRGFDISAYAGMTDVEYEEMTPFQWPARAARGGAAPKRFFAKGGFYTPNRRGRLIAVAPRETGDALSDAFPLLLNTGRVRDHWHTMTRTAKSPRLSRHIAEPYLEIHPEDAAALGIQDAELARVESRHGAAILRARVSDKQRRGSVFAPMHWTAETASLARIDALVEALVDPVSGQPESKRTPVRVARLAAAWHGFALTRDEPTPECAYWAKARAKGGWRVELAGEAPIEDAEAFARALLGPRGEMLRYQDAAAGAHRFALFEGEVLLGALFLAAGPIPLARDWLAEALASAETPEQLRRSLLAGRGGAKTADQGPVVCVCENVGARTIEAAIAAGADSVDAIGAACRAGTNCGSCRTDLSQMLETARKTRAGRVAAE